jgi:hypothetical protein
MTKLDDDGERTMADPGRYDLAVEGIARFDHRDHLLDFRVLDEVDWVGLREAERLHLATLRQGRGFPLGYVELTKPGKSFHAVLKGERTCRNDADRRRDLVPYAEVLREFGPEIANREARPPVEHRRHIDAAVQRLLDSVGYDTGRAA